jgi:hypothetical protein
MREFAVSFHASHKFDSACRGVPTIAWSHEQSSSARAYYYYAGCCFESRSPFLPVAVVSRKHPCLASLSRLAFCDGAVDGSQYGAAHGLGASCAGVVDFEAGDYVAGELGLAEDGDAVVRCFADAVDKCQFVIANWQSRLATHVGSLKVSLSSMVKSIPFSNSSTGSYSSICQATELLPQDL